MTLKHFNQTAGPVDWPSFFLMAFCYIAFGLATSVLASWSAVAGIVAASLAITLHSSLQHEAIHGHILRSDWARSLSVSLAIGLFVPYERFRATHLAHHDDEQLTDPYDDPESNFQHPEAWTERGLISRGIYNFNNTLFGRMMIGPALSLISFYRSDLSAIWRGDKAVFRAYLLHGIGLVPVLIWIEMISPLHVGQMMLAAYLGMSVLKVRTFLEHRAHEDAEGRTVIIEDRGLFAFLFLNNNYHALHHQEPSLKWYELPKAYAQSREAVLAQNKDYRYGNYAEVFRKFFLKRKDPVAHPLR